jgi:hypothetical protein
LQTVRCYMRGMRYTDDLNITNATVGVLSTIREWLCRSVAVTLIVSSALHNELGSDVPQAQPAQLPSGNLPGLARPLPTPAEVDAREFEGYRPTDKWYLVTCGSEVGIFPGS